jgi:hypothetical protein
MGTRLATPLFRVSKRNSVVLLRIFAPLFLVVSMVNTAFADSLSARVGQAPQPTVMIGVRANQDGQASLQAPLASERDVLLLEDQIGRKVAIDNQYSNWADFSTSQPLEQAAWDVRGGRIPMISWKTAYPGSPDGCAKWSDIVGGVYDAQLADQAKVIKNLRGLVMIRWHYEMEHPDGGRCFYDVDVMKDPVTAGQEYVAAWKHVVDLFRAEGVSNVLWVWAPGGGAFSDSDGNPSTEWMDFYPGDDYVDWIGADVYNKSPTTSTPIDAYPTFVNFYSQASTRGKPLMVSETGAVGADPQMDGDGYGCPYQIGEVKPDPGSMWILSAIATFRTKFPAMRAFVYWNNFGLGGPKHCNNYILRGPSMNAFAKMAHDRYFTLRARGQGTTAGAQIRP